MVDHSTFGAADEVSETDLVDQTTPADYQEPDDPEVTAQDSPPEADPRAGWDADPADVAEQFIAVPIDDEDREES
ncbi:hypothetical protein IU449_23860 [Nocardia higoensis]|uniref:Uncharacterized protein n=1 Tax=Nocardia higoensis TaxID=228599 RepID=A0ABS0DGF0_9NOCA|nr:hypothetical protein [Nocardia higoensis]MBF6357548.1 hypothetical protein [Nocardia higoensis]